MGKKRLIDEQKISAFEAEMNEFAKQNGHPKGFVMAKRVRAQIIHAARDRNKSIETVLSEIREGIKQVILQPDSIDWTTVLPPTMPPTSTRLQ